MIFPILSCCFKVNGKTDCLAYVHQQIFSFVSSKLILITIYRQLNKNFTRMIDFDITLIILQHFYQFCFQNESRIIFLPFNKKKMNNK